MQDGGLLCGFFFRPSAEGVMDFGKAGARMLEHLRDLGISEPAIHYLYKKYRKL